MDKILINRSQAARILDVSLPTVDKRLEEMQSLERYEMPVYHIGRSVRINLLCLMDYLGNYDRIELGLPLPPFNPKKLAEELALDFEI